MRTPRALLPDTRTLSLRLGEGLRDGPEGGRATVRPVAILDRRLPRMMSTFPNEVVTCRNADGSTRRVFIKYGRGLEHDSFGHRGGISYEAEVYRRVLRPVPGFRPRYLGSHRDAATGETWLMLEYIARCVRVGDIGCRDIHRQPGALARAARWIGRFHALHEARVDGGDLPFLKRYDRDYFRGWARRTVEFAAPWHERYPWLPDLCRRGDEYMAPLLEAPHTVIHGEFYAKTVLLRRGRIFLVDWESAAVSAGEIDLASLTEGTGWPRAFVRLCEDEYARARWPEGAPAEFRRRLDAARVYLHFRWLGERPDWTTRDRVRWRYVDLHAAARRLDRFEDPGRTRPIARLVDGAIPSG